MSLDQFATLIKEMKDKLAELVGLYKEKRQEAVAKVKGSPKKDDSAKTPETEPKEETPAEGASEETPAESTSEETPAEGTSEETPAEGASEETPAEGTSEETPAEGASEETPAEGKKPGVGEGCENKKEDVIIVQKSIVQIGITIKVDGVCGPKTLAALEEVLKSIGCEATRTLIKDSPAWKTLMGVLGQNTDEAEEVESEVVEDKTPAESTNEETPAEGASEETPAESTSEETPAESTSEETPAESTSEETPAESTSEETPAEGASEETPAESTSEETPAEGASEETPAESTSEETPAEGKKPGVGEGCENKTEDVITVQKTIVQIGINIKVDGICGPKTLAALEQVLKGIGCEATRTLIKDSPAWKTLMSVLGQGQDSSEKEETPAEGASEETPAESTSEETPAEGASEETPAESTSEETPAESTSEETPAESTSEETPAEGASEETPAEGASEDKKEEEAPAASSGTKLSGSVGRGGQNAEADVRAVQERLVRNAIQVEVDGKIGPQTQAAIERFQQHRIGQATGLIEPDSDTWKALLGQNVPRVEAPQGQQNQEQGSTGGPDFSHPAAGRVSLSYGANAVKLNQRAENLLKSILASVNIFSANITSTLRTYHDQARITMTQTSDSNTVTWYGQDVLDAKRRFSGNIQAFAQWWAERDRRLGRVSSRHLTNIAMDVVPAGNRATFANKVQELVPVSGSGVRRIIPKGVMGEPVDHVEFTFPVTNKSAI